MLQEYNLTDEEKSIMEGLARIGAAVPAELAAKTFLLPEEVYPHLESLKGKGLIETREASGLITLTDRGLRYLKLSRMANQAL
jgi:DNA-binding MarR family transcriptional regulator